MKKKELSLREIKFARTKLALLDAALAQLPGKPFDEITLGEICAAAEVSYATFFNYFGKKSDLLFYFIQLWSIEVSHHARGIEKEAGGVKAIESIFQYTARQCGKSPEIMGEIVSFLARRREKDTSAIAPLTGAEKRLRFPDIDDFEGLAEMGLLSLFPGHIETAIRKGELPPGTNVQEMVLALAVIFQGVPVTLGLAGAQNYAAAYRHQLRLLWAGARATLEEDLS
ncbi:MAG: TetR/AcrR family transcriptional regulator [Nitrospinae bacterium]|nr:TetR/AcrR family transcriptional regulator [Nitrospinota bacterium]